MDTQLQETIQEVAEAHKENAELLKNAKKEQQLLKNETALEMKNMKKQDEK